MTMIESVKTCLSKYATFSGRASRSEFWWLILFWLLVGSALSFIDGLVFAPATFDVGSSSGDLELQYGFSTVFGLSVFIPLCAVFSRRLHDAGHSLVTGVATLLLPIPLLFLIMVVTIGLGFGDITLLGPDQSMFERMRGIVIFAVMVIPVLIPLVVLYWLVRKSENDANQFGPNPLEVTP